VDQRVQEWKGEYDRIQAQNQSGSSLSESFTQALDLMPQLNERKKKLDMHANLATCLLQNIQQRSLDKLQDIEDAMLENKKLSGAVLAEWRAFLSKDKESPEQRQDLLRVLLIYAQSQVSFGGLGEFKQMLREVRDT